MLRVVLRAATAIVFFFAFAATFSPRAFAEELAPSPASETAARWRDEWPRFRPIEYAYTVAALGSSFALRFAGPSPDADWRGGILFDDALVDRMGVEAPQNRDMAARVSDVGYFGSMGYRAFDSLLFPLVAYGDSELALQMTMIDLEVFGTVAVLIWTPQAFFGRERPKVTRLCADRQRASGIDECLSGDDDRNRSFFGGHNAVAMAAAGLTCMHHGHIPLYGGGADELACGVTVGAAVMTGVARVWAESHYPSDVIVGWGVGALAGWGLPAALHYGFSDEKRYDARRAPRRRSEAVRMTAIPWVGRDQLGGKLAGLW